MPFKISQLFEFDLIVSIKWLSPLKFNQKYSQKWSTHFITKGFTTSGQSSLETHGMLAAFSKLERKKLLKCDQILCIRQN